ncbi:hypothetical protein PFLUV_G00218770 [Perca fluviatilis]|uniref:CSD domain-containing protein n=1 Tax=Perca fluviatilis TaxID=8168 RepID=A0A6A5DR70_PERFL|nr:hypothetical protein PFLUV_G00218770 [Perca fluviatilis]
MGRRAGDQEDRRLRLAGALTRTTGDLLPRTTGDPHTPMIGDLHTRTGDLHTRTGDLHTRTGDLRTQTGDLHTQTGDLRTQTGDLRAGVPLVGILKDPLSLGDRRLDPPDLYHRSLLRGCLHLSGFLRLLGSSGGPPWWREPMPNHPPISWWIKALISAPPSEATVAETKSSSEEPAAPKPAAEPPAAPKPKPKPDTARALGLLGKRTFDKPPPGRSTGIISFIGPTFGYIEREDLEKFTFSFSVFFGNPKAMKPGVRVHFTACKEKKALIATDVKVAPGGTENVDTEIYEAVVSQPITEPQPGERQYPGQVHVDIGPLRTNLTFDRKDSTVTLLQNDQVLINLLTDIVTEKRRATNIKPKIPSTFSHTGEAREQLARGSLGSIG